MKKSSRQTKPAKALAALKPLSLRQAKRHFRFDKGRDDLHLKGLTTHVFTTLSPLDEQGRDVGTFGAPVGVLLGYASVVCANGNRSVKATQDSKVMGRLVEVTMDELAKLDAVAEFSGSNYHRFKASIILPQVGHSIEAWVFQDLDHAGPDELRLSVTAEPTPPVLTGSAKLQLIAA